MKKSLSLDFNNSPRRLRNRLIPRKKPIPEINLEVTEEIQNCQNNVYL
ncbi:unnamed protein product, partial [Brachionus calyciflorus]